jgi:hypothetical protein
MQKVYQIVKYVYKKASVNQVFIRARSREYRVYLFLAVSLGVHIATLLDR